MKDKSFDVRDFRRALGKFPTGVTIVTSVDTMGSPVGVTASSFNSVSIDPPLILWSVDKNSHSAPIFEQSEYFAVNVLDKSQVEMSNRFAGRGQDKFGGVVYQNSEYGASPLFDDCAAQFECKTWSVYEGGDHLIIVGEVLKYQHFDATSSLVFSDGSYAISMQHPSSLANADIKTSADCFLGDYLLYLLRVAYTQCSSHLYPELLNAYSITPEEWRVLTLLSDAGSAEADYLAKTVGQPLDTFNTTFERMKGKGFLVQVPQQKEKIALTDQGHKIAEQAFELARSQEAMILSHLTEQQQSELKSNLKQVAQSLG